MKLRKYSAPGFLDGLSVDEYTHWLGRKAASLLKRDRHRGIVCTKEKYKEMIHQAVIESNGQDAYTGEDLDWGLLSKYKNDESKEGRIEYKKKFALLPTVDHYTAGDSSDFRICAWRTNDAKNDLSLDEFKELCRKVLGYDSKHSNP